MSVLLAAVLPIALVVLAGYAVGRFFTLELQTLARVNIYAMLPALVLTSLGQATLALESAIGIVATFLVNTALLYLLAAGSGRVFKLKLEERKSLVATTLFSNVGNMGLPFILFALGEAGLERALVYLVASSLTIATVFPIVLKGSGLGEGVRFTLCFPVFWAALAGLAVQVGWLQLPAAVDRGVTLLGQGVIPIALVTLGGQLARTKVAVGRYEWFGSGLRLLVAPALAYGIGRSLGLVGLDLQVVVLQAAMPVAVNSLIWVTELGGDRRRVAGTIVLSTLLSFVTLPGVLWLVTR